MVWASSFRYDKDIDISVLREGELSWSLPWVENTMRKDRYKGRSVIQRQRHKLSSLDWLLACRSHSQTPPSSSVHIDDSSKPTLLFSSSQKFCEVEKHDLGNSVMSFHLSDGAPKVGMNI